MDVPSLIVYRRAGYTYLLMYEVWLIIAREWKATNTPVRADDVEAHLHALEIRAHHGEVQSLRVVLLQDGSECPALIPASLQGTLQAEPAALPGTPE